MTAELQPFDPQRVIHGRGRPDGPGEAEVASVSRADTRSVALGWRDAMRAAAVAVRERPALIGVGLLGFLARGGVVVFLLPIVVLPTPTGISNFIGGTALTGAGASDPLIRLIAAGAALVVVLVLAGVLLGAIADVLLVRAALASGLALAGGNVTAEGRDRARREAAVTIRATPSLVGQVVLIRFIALVPVALAAAWGTARLVAAGYHQLILPDDLTVPLALRILIEALDAAVVVIAVWLVAEFLGGVAVRHVIVGRRSAPVAIVAAMSGVMRRPVTSVATYATGVMALAIVAGLTLLGAAVLWGRLQEMLSDDVLVLFALPATFVFVLVWGGGLALVGAVAAWRSVFGSLDVLRSRSVPPARGVAQRPAFPGVAELPQGSAPEER